MASRDDAAEPSPHPGTATVPGQRRVPDAESGSGGEPDPPVDPAGTDGGTETRTLAVSGSVGVADRAVDADGVEEIEDAEAADAAEDQDDWPSPLRQIAHAVRILCVLIIAVLLGHRFLPNVMGFGSLLDTFLPWTFVPLAVVLPVALGSRSRWAMATAALAACVWGADFGPSLAPRGSSGPADLRILSQNVSAQKPDLAAAANLAVERGADVVVLQGMSSGDVQASEAVWAATLKSGYRYHLALYEFSVWSKYPLGSGQPIDLVGLDPASAATGGADDSGLFGGLLRFSVHVADGKDMTVYAVHLPQPALSHHGFAVARDQALERLVAAVGAEKAANLVVVGDLDLAETDRAMGGLLNGGTGLVSVHAKSGSGFGFTWPAQFPMVRLDDALVRGLTPVRSTVLGATGAKQAHRPIEADLRF